MDSYVTKWENRPPTGALRPPVAVGPLDEDDYEYDYGGPGSAGVGGGAGGGGCSASTATSSEPSRAAWKPRLGNAAIQNCPTPCRPFHAGNDTGNIGLGRSGWGAAAGEQDFGGEIDRWGSDSYMPAEDYTQSGSAAASQSAGGWAGVALADFDAVDEPPSGGYMYSEHARGIVGGQGFGDSRFSAAPQTPAPQRGPSLDRWAATNRDSAPTHAAAPPQEGVARIIGGGVGGGAWGSTNPAPAAPLVQKSEVSHTSKAISFAHDWVAQRAHPIQASSLSYPNGVQVQLSELSSLVPTLSASNISQASRIRTGLDNGELLWRTLQTYRECDCDGNGFLSWNNGEVRNFLTLVFRQQGLAPPMENEMYELYRRFDVGRNSILDAGECIFVVDALLRAIASVEARPSPGVSLAEAAQLPAHPAAPQAGTPALCAPPQQMGPGPVGPWPVQHAPQPVQVQGLPQPPQQMWPTPILPSAQVPHSAPAAASQNFGPIRPFPAPPPLPQPSAGALRVMQMASSLPTHPSVAPLVHKAPSMPHAHPAAPHHDNPRLPFRVGQMAPRPVSPQPHAFHHDATGGRREQRHEKPSEEDAYAPYHHDHPHAQQQHHHHDRPSSPPRSAPGVARANHSTVAPKPPKLHEQERRPHCLDVELEELELHPAGDHDHLKPGWLETLKYFVSLHPHTGDHEDIMLPREVPKESVPGKQMVSNAAVPKRPDLQIASTKRAGAFADVAGAHSSWGGGKSRVTSSTMVNPIVKFTGEMSLVTDRLDTVMVCYVWGKKSSMTSESTTLIGRAILHLHEFETQRRLMTFPVHDVADGTLVADLRLRYSVSTSPGPVSDIVVTAATRSEVTLRWDPPANDHGARIIGYKIAILLDGDNSDEPEWMTICECTKSPKPAFVVANLAGNTTYTLEISAVNKVGVGDRTECQATTGPVEPGPPTKPWIEESRDGCLNVAWSPPTTDGGFPVLAYRIRMRKILGATPFNQWHGMGPSHKHAQWIDMGTVQAESCEEGEDPLVYDAWVGPLESTSCEYRFQIHALNKAGEGEGSELSDSHYT